MKKAYPHAPNLLVLLTLMMPACSLRTNRASCRKFKVLKRISCCCYVIRGRGNFWREKLIWRAPPGTDIWRAFSFFLFKMQIFYGIMKKMTSSYRFCEESWLKMSRRLPSRNWIGKLSRRGLSRRSLHGLEIFRN